MPNPCDLPIRDHLWRGALLKLTHLIEAGVVTRPEVLRALEDIKRCQGGLVVVRWSGDALSLVPGRAYEQMLRRFMSRPMYDQGPLPAAVRRAIGAMEENVVAKNVVAEGGGSPGAVPSLTPSESPGPTPSSSLREYGFREVSYRGQPFLIRTAGFAHTEGLRVLATAASNLGVSTEEVAQGIRRLRRDCFRPPESRLGALARRAAQRMGWRG